MTPQNPIAKPLAINPYNHISSTSSSSSSFSLFSTFGPSSFPQQSKRLPDNWFLDRSRAMRDFNSHNESGEQVLFAIEAIVENDLLYRKIAS
ncbi:hypothetical protein ACJIZ3_008642 [Penstemon smallii]|uniref:Uncharacterized protein n=1 Tax=Penstemon smallii TaxID=265156 RepID=A0ABD3TBB3_9LAMI